MENSQMEKATVFFSFDKTQVISKKDKIFNFYFNFNQIKYSGILQTQPNVFWKSEKLPNMLIFAE